MQKNEKLRTKSAPKKTFIVFSLLFIVAGFIAWSSLRTDRADEYVKLKCIQIDQECFNVEVADTKPKQIKGLSGRKHLPQDQGIIFVFNESEEQCFWMKDMHFNIDMIWLNEQKQIVKINNDVAPSTYPDLFCADDTRYVLEFNNGFAKKHGLKEGSTLQF